MRVSDIMARHFNSVDSRSSVLEAAQVLLKHRVSGLPVIDDASNLVGVITSNDILRQGQNEKNKHRPRWLGAVLRRGESAENYSHLFCQNVRTAMSAQFNWTTEEISIDDIERFLNRSRLKWLPVMRDGKLVGIVNRHELESAKLLLCRINKIREPDTIAGKPAYMREMIRLCLSCENQRQCKKDLESPTLDTLWKKYCRNAQNFLNLQGQRATEMLAALGRALETAGI